MSVLLKNRYLLKETDTPIWSRADRCAPSISLSLPGYTTSSPPLSVPLSLCWLSVQRRVMVGGEAAAVGGEATTVTCGSGSNEWRREVRRQRHVAPSFSPHQRGDGSGVRHPPLCQTRRVGRRQRRAAPSTLPNPTEGEATGTADGALPSARSDGGRQRVAPSDVLLVSTEVIVHLLCVLCLCWCSWCRNVCEVGWLFFIHGISKVLVPKPAPLRQPQRYRLRKPAPMGVF